MRNLVPFGLEELLSFRPGNCHGCRELHNRLKEALMEYLLSATSTYVYGGNVADMRLKNVESGLAHALMEFQAHRKDTHFVECFPLPWIEMPARSAS